MYKNGDEKLISVIMGPGKYRALVGFTNPTNTLSYEMQLQLHMNEVTGETVGPDPEKLASLQIQKVKTIASLWAEHVNLELKDRENIWDAIRRNTSKWANVHFNDNRLPSWVTDEVCAFLLK
jgi:hypothetical protein